MSKRHTFINNQHLSSQYNQFSHQKQSFREFLYYIPKINNINKLLKSFKTSNYLYVVGMGDVFKVGITKSPRSRIPTYLKPHCLPVDWLYIIELPTDFSKLVESSVLQFFSPIKYCLYDTSSEVKEYFYEESFDITRIAKLTKTTILRNFKKGKVVTFDSSRKWLLSHKYYI